MNEMSAQPAAGKSSSRSVSTIGTSAVITGEIKGGEDLLVLGNFDGTVVLDKNTVTVGKNGMLKGKVQAKVIMVEGMVNGDLIAGEKIVLKASAKVKANIITARLVMDDGCHFQGGIDMSVLENKPKQTATPAIRPDSANNKVIKNI